MLYGLAALLLSPLLARITERTHAHTSMVLGGALLSAAGMLPACWLPHPLAVLAGIAALGTGQAMSISAQLVLVSRATEAEAEQAGAGAVLGVFRMIERLGAAAGPALAGALAAVFGLRQALLVLAVAGLGCALLYALCHWIWKDKQ
jgi:MFS family permease